MSVSLSNGVLTAPAEEIIAAALEVDLRRTAEDVLNMAPVQINSGTPGLLAGRITYLCADLPDLLDLIEVYKANAVCTLTTGAALDGLRHKAVGRMAIGAERALPGHPAKWTLQVEIREQP